MVKTEFLPIYTALYPLMPLYVPLCFFMPLLATLCPFLALYAPLFPFMPLCAPSYCLHPFTSLYTSLQAFTCFYMLYKLSSSQDLVVGLVYSRSGILQPKLFWTCLSILDFLIKARWVVVVSRPRKFDTKGIRPPLLSQNSPKFSPYSTLLFSMIAFSLPTITFES